MIVFSFRSLGPSCTCLPTAPTRRCPSGRASWRRAATAHEFDWASNKKKPRRKRKMDDAESKKESKLRRPKSELHASGGRKERGWVNRKAAILRLRAEHVVDEPLSCTCRTEGCRRLISIKKRRKYFDAKKRGNPPPTTSRSNRGGQPSHRP